MPYTTLKVALLQCIGISDSTCLHALLTAEALGNCKLLQMLRHIQQLLGNNTLDKSILRHLFLQHLPSNVHFVLACHIDAILNIFASLGNQVHTCSVNKTSMLCEISPIVDSLHGEIDALCHELQSTRNSSCCQLGGASRSCKASASATTELRWYHTKFRPMLKSVVRIAPFINKW